MDNLKEFVYWDNAATTKVDQRVLDAMLPYFTHYYGNASSNHQFGKIAKNAVENARKQVAKLINSDEKEIIFTSGATESINMALKGYVESNNAKGNHIITVKTEHKAVLSTCEYLEERGIEVTYLNVDSIGLISLDELENAIKPNTILISVMYINNEIGVIQPIKQIGEIAKQNSIAFFCDATQAIGKVKIDIETDNIDMLSFSGHKINGPKGIGVLFKKKHIKLTPLIHGGSQEDGLRAGTYNTPLIVGLGISCEIIDSYYNYDYNMIEAIKNKLKIFECSDIIAVDNKNHSNIITIYIKGLNVDLFMSQNSKHIIGNGSACNSSIIQQSHVLKALKTKYNDLNGFFRICISNQNDIEKIEMLFQEMKFYICD